jgi:KRAB domain-containing zinc finger protein
MTEVLDNNKLLSLLSSSSSEEEEEEELEEEEKEEEKSEKYFFEKEEESYSCSRCDKEFSKKEAMEIHQTIKHQLFAFKCPKKGCKRTFIREEYLKKHIFVDHISRIEKPYKCKKNRKCIDKGIAFRTQGELNQHLKRHGPKDHICDICGNGFAMKAYLESHMRSHTGKKVHPCRIKGCNEKFVSSSSRQWHEKQAHQ